MANPDISVTGISSLKALNLVEKLHIAGSDKLKNEGSIRIGSETYKVTYVPGNNGADKLQMKRNYTGFLIGRFLNWWNRDNLTTQPHAVALTDKVNELMKTTDYQLVRNTYDKLMEIAKANTGDKNGVIEVGNYGHSQPRNKIQELGVVDAVNRSLRGSGKSIRLNKIDTYNTFLGITNRTLMPDSYGALMKKIAGGGLAPNEKMMDAEDNEFYTVEHDDLQQWRTFISRPEIAAKIDIPRKLHAYLNQGGGQGDDDQLVGWKKDFRTNPDAALRHFVVKNMPASFMRAGKLNDEVITKMCDKLRDYVEIYNMADGPDKEERMRGFFDPSKWDETAADKARLKKEVAPIVNAMAKKLNRPPEEVWKHHGKAIIADFCRKNPLKALECRDSYVLFADILMYATFRQTSKLGLDFFKSQGKPVLFHMSNRDLSDFGDPGWILNENHWKSGQLDPTYGGSEITHSEVRHASKLIERYGTGVNGANLWHVNGAQ